MTAEDQAAAAPADPDDGRVLARTIARQAVAASRRRRATADRRERDARAGQVRRAAAPDPPSPIVSAAASTEVEWAETSGEAVQTPLQPPPHDQARPQDVPNKD